MLKIELAEEEDWPRIWPIIKEVVRKGETYALPIDSTEVELYMTWMDHPSATYVAKAGGAVLGTYYIKPNHPGNGSHVCNVGYMVSANRRGSGIGRKMCAHSLETAAALGFHAMQYNLVVSTNSGAVRLWQAMGFQIIGTLPEAFNHPNHGLVDAHVMYRLL